MAANDITKQSQYLNGDLKEKKYSISSKPKENEDIVDVDKAMIIQSEIMDVFLRNNCSLRDGYIISSAVAEALYSYAMFGDMLK